MEKIPWCQGKSNLTTPLVILLAERSKLLALGVVAEMFGVSWPTVGSAGKQAVAYGLAHRRLGKLGSLGIDEISRRKGHTYHTQIYDLERKRLLDSMEDRKAESLEKFLDPLGAARLKGIAAVHEKHILAWHDCRINNGAVEALNNVAKAISHRCHGFKSAAWFRTVLLLCMGDLPMPKFTHKFS